MSRLARGVGSTVGALRRLFHVGEVDRYEGAAVGLALGGGFARGIAHIGVLQVLEENRIPISCIAGVSAGSIIAAAYASGTPVAKIEETARKMRFRDIGRWTISRMGLVTSERMNSFLQRLLSVYRFEEMRIPLAVVATDLCTGGPVIFQGSGDVILPIRASCSYPGLFLPIRQQGCDLVDGAIGMDVPAAPLRAMGARRVISVCLEAPNTSFDTSNMLSVINRCIQILQKRVEHEWRQVSDVIIEPDVRQFAWDAFVNSRDLVEAGRRAALAALPAIRRRSAEPVRK